MPNPAREETVLGGEVHCKAISLMSCKTWERQEEGADMRLEETKEELHLCLSLLPFAVPCLAP